MAATDVPAVLFMDIFSSGKFSSENLVTRLLNSELGESSENCGDRSSFERLLSLQTKYYTATVKLDWVPVGGSPAVEVVHFWRNSVEAVILNGADGDGEFTEEIHEKLDQLLDSVESDSSEAELLKLLVVNCVSSNDEVETKALKWCAGRGVELVELNPTVEKIEELTNCRELYGLERVKQALKSHTWSNAVALGEQNEFLDALNAPKRKEEARDIVKASAREQVFDDKTGGAELGEAKFEELFEKFAELKAKADELPPGEERKEYAAEVATAFYEALVGSEQSDDDEQ